MRALASASLLLLACGDAAPTTGAVGDASTSAGSSSTTSSTTAAPTTTEPVSSTSSTGDTTGPATAASTSTTGSTDAGTGAPLDPAPLRVLAINVGNASPQFGCFEYKLCRAQDIDHLKQYLDVWRPDVVLVSEVLRAEQLAEFLPPGYDGRCGESRDRHTGEPAAWDAADASHEHECVAWDTARVTEIDGSARSAYGRNDAYGQDKCNYDFTGFAVDLQVDGAYPLTAVAIHPDSQDGGCRTEEIARYWSALATGARTVIGGDWNTDSDDELQRPDDFAVAYLRGQHWDLAFHDGEWSAEYAFGLEKKRFDHSFARGPATPRTADLPFGSALGGYDDHPRADGGDGMDHRQVLFDLTLQP